MLFRFAIRGSEYSNSYSTSHWLTKAKISILLSAWRQCCISLFAATGQFHCSVHLCDGPWNWLIVMQLAQWQMCPLHPNFAPKVINLPLYVCGPLNSQSDYSYQWNQSPLLVDLSWLWSTFCSVKPFYGAFCYSLTWGQLNGQVATLSMLSWYWAQMFFFLIVFTMC